MSQQGPFKFFPPHTSPRQAFVSHQLYWTHYKEELKDTEAPRILENQKQADQPMQLFWERLFVHPSFIKLAEETDPANHLTELMLGAKDHTNTDNTLEIDFGQLTSTLLKDEGLSPQDKAVLEILVSTLLSWQKDPDKKMFFCHMTKNPGLKAINLFMVSQTSSGPIFHRVVCSIHHRKISLELVNTEVYLHLLANLLQHHFSAWKTVRAHLCDTVDRMMTGFKTQAGDNFDAAVALNENCTRICSTDYVAVFCNDEQVRLFPSYLFKEDKILLQGDKTDRTNAGELVGTKRPSVQRVRIDTGARRRQPENTTQELLIYRLSKPLWSKTNKTVRIFFTPENSLTADLPDDSLALE